MIMNRYNNEYTQKAHVFLKKTGVVLTVQYLKTAKHFPSDKEARDIYTFSLVRGEKSYTAEFGDSVKNTEENRHLAIRRKPTAYDILACLTAYETAENVDDFASEFGYEKPSEAVRVFEAVKKEYAALRDMFNDQELSELQEIN